MSVTMTTASSKLRSEVSLVGAGGGGAGVGAGADVEHPATINSTAA